MKKVLFAAVAVLALASCKKEYTCKYPSLLPDVKYSEKDYTQEQLDMYKMACEAAGGTWKSK